MSEHSESESNGSGVRPLDAVPVPSVESDSSFERALEYHSEGSAGSSEPRSMEAESDSISREFFREGSEPSGSVGQPSRMTEEEWALVRACSPVQRSWS